MYCTFCLRKLTYMHGHGTCVNVSCMMFGLNQDECCQGAPLSQALTNVGGGGFLDDPPILTEFDTMGD